MTSSSTYAKGSFLNFHAVEFQRRLETCEIPGIDGFVSWDRRAAYLLWVAEGNDPNDIGEPVALKKKKAKYDDLI